MKLPMPERTGGLRFDLTPMIDVVFNLIIFFLAASHLANAEGTEPVRLPDALSSRDDDAPSAQRLVITIPARGGYLLGNKTILLSELEQLLKLKANRPETAKQFEVRLRLDKETPYRNMEPLVVLCAKLGIPQLRLAVMRPASGMFPWEAGR